MGSLSKSAWYHAALAAKNEGRELPPVSENEPEVGFFFRKASKQGGRIPVVIYDDANGDRVARSGTRSEHRIEDAGAVWTWVAKTPIERDSYVWAWEKDKWPDGSPTRGVEDGAATSATSSNSHQWEWYKKALANDPSIEALSDDGTVRSGFFWTKASRRGGRVPVAIWTENDVVRCRFGTLGAHRDYGIDFVIGRWPFIFPNFVPREDYEVAWSTGVWPDGSPTTSPGGTLGDNAPADPFERLLAEVEDKVASATALIEDAAAKQDQTRADRARHLQAELLALNKSADGMFETEKAPHLAAVRAVTEKFRFRDRVKEVCARLRVVAENILKAEEARLREEARIKHEAALREAQAERDRIEADRAKLMIDDPIKAMTDPEPELPPIPAEPEPVRVRAGGGVGRAMGLQSVWIGDIVDYEATVHHYRKHPEVRDLIEKLVKRAVKADKSEANIPGVKVREDRRAA